MKSRSGNIAIFIFLLFGVLPFVAALSYAVLYSFGFMGYAGGSFTLHHWEAVLSSGSFVQSLVYSIMVAGLGVLFSIGLALAMSLGLRRQMSSGAFGFLIYLPLAIPGVVAAFFTLQLFSRAGFFSRLSYQLGWISEPRQFPELVNDPGAIGIILTFVALLTPFFSLLYVQVYRNERVGELEALARSMGAGRRQILRRVTLPILIRKTAILIFLYFIFLLGAYEVPLILGQESPQMLSVLVIRELNQFDISKMAEGYVVAVIYTVLVSTAVLALQLRKSTKDRAIS